VDFPVVLIIYATRTKTSIDWFVDRLLYLLTFLLSSLSESSDENMMDAHNLSVCFGPTLMPLPPDHDQVRNQNYVNELIRILIVYHEKIFPTDAGIMYEKCMVEEEG